MFQAFNEVGVVLPNKLKAFRESDDDVTLKYCKAKYLFYYDFIFNSLMQYHIGVALNASGKIISPFTFPSKKEYKAIDTTFNYCRLIEIASKVRKDIKPIKEIQITFNNKTKRFYWLIIQEIKKQKEEINYFYEVEIDATNLTKARLVKAEAHIVY